MGDLFFILVVSAVRSPAAADVEHASTVTAAKQVLGVVHDRGHTRLYVAKYFVTLSSDAVGGSRGRSRSSAPATGSDGGSRSSRCRVEQPR